MKIPVVVFLFVLSSSVYSQFLGNTYPDEYGRSFDGPIWNYATQRVVSNRAVFNIQIGPVVSDGYYVVSGSVNWKGDGREYKCNLRRSGSCVTLSAYSEVTQEYCNEKGQYCLCPDPSGSKEDYRRFLLDIDARFICNNEDEKLILAYAGE